MSKIALSGNASGTGTFTIASPNSNSDRTVGLPDASGELYIAGTPLSASTGEFTGAVSIGANWTFAQSGTEIVASYNGTRRFKVDASGNAVVSGNVTAYGTV